MTRRLPAQPDQISAEILAGLLRDSGVISTSTIERVRWRDFAEDRGFTGVISRGRVSYGDRAPDDLAPATVVAKFPMAERDVQSTASIGRRNGAAQQDHFGKSVRELRFYQEIAPGAKVPVPRLYAGQVDHAAMNVAFFLEDITDAVGGDPLRGCSPDHVIAVVDAIARLHVWGWDRSDVDWLPQPTGSYHASEERYAGYVEPFLARWGPWLPAGVHEIARRLAGKLHWVLSELDRAPASVIHGDLHLDNVVFRSADASRPAVILDWQGIRRGPVVQDIASFVLGALAPGDRRANAERIFSTYRGQLDGGRATGYNVEAFDRDVKLVLLRRLAGVVNWAVHAESAPISARERALVEANFTDDRLASALLDYQVAELLAEAEY